jgi:hypothetical protein
MKKITISKYMGDDLYSWAVFVDGKPVETGLSRREAQYSRDERKKREQNGNCSVRFQRPKPLQ